MAFVKRRISKPSLQPKKWNEIHDLWSDPRTKFLKSQRFRGSVTSTVTYLTKIVFGWSREIGRTYTSNCSPHFGVYLMPDVTISTNDVPMTLELLVASLWVVSSSYASPSFGDNRNVNNRLICVVWHLGKLDDGEKMTKGPSSLFPPFIDSSLTLWLCEDNEVCSINQSSESNEHSSLETVWSNEQGSIWKTRETKNGWYDKIHEDFCCVYLGII